MSAPHSPTQADRERISDFALVLIDDSNLHSRGYDVEPGSVEKYSGGVWVVEDAGEWVADIPAAGDGLAAVKKAALDLVAETTGLDLSGYQWKRPTGTNFDFQLQATT